VDSVADRLKPYEASTLPIARDGLGVGDADDRTAVVKHVEGPVPAGSIANERDQPVLANGRRKTRDQLKIAELSKIALQQRDGRGAYWDPRRAATPRAKCRVKKNKGAVPREPRCVVIPEIMGQVFAERDIQLEVLRPNS